MKRLINFILINIFMFLIALIDVLIFIPYGFTSGGLFGLSIAIAYFFSFNKPWFVSLIFVLLNLPLFVYSYKNFSKEYFWNSLYITCLLSFCITIIGFLCKNFKIGIQNLWIISIIGSLFQGISMGTIIFLGASTGGVDIIARILNKFLKNIKLGFMISLISIFIILITSPIVGYKRMLASILSMFILGDSIDFTNEILNFLTND